jgi:hypothetical protein
MNTFTNSEIKHTLKLALKKISNGWTKGVMREVKTVGGEKKPCFCAVGAVQYSTTNNERCAVAIQHLAKFVPSDKAGWSVMNFNDAAATRRRDVESMFKRAIKAL